MRADITESYPGGTLESIEMEFRARFHRADDSHDIHILRTFDSDVEWDLTIGRPDQPADGNEQAAGNYSGSGDLDAIIFDTDSFTQDVRVTLSVDITAGSVSPPTTSPRPDVGANNPLFEVYDPYMDNRSRPLEPDITLSMVQDNVVSSELRTGAASWETSSDVPNILVVPDQDFEVPGENVTITDDYPEFDDYYTNGGGDTDEDLDPDPTFDEWFLNPSP